MKRPAPWQARRIATAKARKALPRCEYTEGCEGRAMGILAKQDPFRLLLACVKCAADARERRGRSPMHECWECGTYCDCDGEDMDQPCPPDHACINPDCGDEDGDVDDFDDLPRANGPRET